MKKMLYAVLLIALVSCTTYDHKEYRTETLDFEATALKIFDLETGNGKITSSVKKGDSLHVTLDLWATGKDSIDAVTHIDSINVHVTPDTSDSSLRIFIELPVLDPGALRTYGCDVTIFTPESIVLNLETSNGDVLVGDQEADFDLTSSNGDLSITDTRGYARLNTSNGSVTVSRHEGNIQAVTSNGDMNADVIMPKSDGTCSFKSSNGSITLAVPDSIGASIWLKTSNGNITVTGLNLEDTNDDDNVYQAVTGDGSGTIEAETSNKDIELKKL